MMRLCCHLIRNNQSSILASSSSSSYHHPFYLSTSSPLSTTVHRNNNTAIVTGASRGIGRGIAIELGRNGYKVYITARHPSKSFANQQNHLPSLHETFNEIKKNGGNAEMVYCDHSNYDDIKKLFDKVSLESNNKLDILVNAAFSGVSDIMEGAGKKFYECDPLLWDSINNVGLRNVYICNVLASRLMVKQHSGLIVNISSAGSLQYFFNVAYGVGKTAIDRMSADMAIELKSENVCILSLWPGTVKTELSKQFISSGQFSALTGLSQDFAERSLKNGETAEFVGRCIVALASDKNLMKKTGRTLLSADLSQHYGLVDIDGRKPSNMRNVNAALDFFGWPNLAKIVPDCFKIPHWALHFSSYKF